MLNGDERLWICTIEYDARTEEEARSNQTSDFSDAADFRGCGGNGWIPITLSEEHPSPEENLEEPVQQLVRDNQEALDQTSDSGELTQPDGSQEPEGSTNQDDSSSPEENSEEPVQQFVR